jgi:hypothetical protein
MMRPGTMKGIIHTDDDCYDLIYWSIKFGVSTEQLLAAIAKVGPLVRNVERHVNPSTAAVADPSAAKPDRYVTRFPDMRTAGLAGGRIVQRDPTVFLVRNDKPGGVEREELVAFRRRSVP